MDRYVRITKGYYRGKVGYYNPESVREDGSVPVMFANRHDNHCLGVRLPARSYVDASRKDYFKAKLHGTL